MLTLRILVPERQVDEGLQFLDLLATAADLQRHRPRILQTPVITFEDGNQPSGLRRFALFDAAFVCATIVNPTVLSVDLDEFPEAISGDFGGVSHCLALDQFDAATFRRFFALLHDEFEIVGPKLKHKPFSGIAL